MNKAKLIQKVSERMDIPSKSESLKKGEGIEIRGFGSFVVRNYGAYKGRNPKTGKSVDVAPKKLPYFKVGKEMKGLVNRIKEEAE